MILTKEQIMATANKLDVEGQYVLLMLVEELNLFMLQHDKLQEQFIRVATEVLQLRHEHRLYPGDIRAETGDLKC